MITTMEGIRPPKNRFEQIIWEVGRMYATALHEVNKQFAEGYIAPYRNPKFKNQIKPVEVARRTLELIKEKFDENLHTPEERVHILRSCKLAFLERFYGGTNIKLVIDRIDKSDPETRQMFAALRDELEHTIPTLERCDELVYEYVHEYIEQLQNPKKDKRKSEKEPTNPEKLRALKEFAPELIDALTKTDKETQGQIIFMITGVRPHQAYQETFTRRKKLLDKVVLKDLDKYLNILKEAKKYPL